MRAAAPNHQGPYPRVQLWHGTSDFIVHPRGMTELVKQWTNVHGIDQTSDATETVSGYPRARYTDESGTTLVETFTLTGKMHGAGVAPSKPIDPAQPTGPKCGRAGSYILDVGICTTYHAAKFFGLDPSPPP